MEKYEENLLKSLSSLKVADHILYVTYPVVKDKKLLLKCIDCIYESLTSLINSILQYDYLWKRIRLYQNPKDNFQTFLDKCSKRYDFSSQELKELLEFLKLAEAHKKSPMEFLRHEKIVIMTDSLKTTLIDSETIKIHLNLAKRLLEKTRLKIKTPIQ